MIILASDHAGYALKEEILLNGDRMRLTAGMNMDIGKWTLFIVDSV